MNEKLLFGLVFLLSIILFANENNISEIKKMTLITLLEQSTNIDRSFSGILMYSFRYANKMSSKYSEYKNGKLVKIKEGKYRNFNHELPRKINGLYYKNKKLYTRTVKTITTFNDYITEYKNGNIINKTGKSYDTILVTTSGIEIRNSLKDLDVWDFTKKIVKRKKYHFGALVEEGNYNFKFKKIGIWKIYTEDGSILKYKEDHDKYKNLFLKRLKKDFTFTKNIENKEWKKVFYKPIVKTEYYDVNGKILNSKEFYSEKNNILGKLIRYSNNKVSDIFYFKNKVNYKFETYYPNGNIKSKQLLKQKGTFFKKWQGYFKEYYPNGNLKRIQTVTEGKAYRSVFDVAKSSMALTATGNNNTQGVGFQHYTSISGPFKEFYINGQLLLEGSNSSNLKENVKIYDKEGNKISFAQNIDNN